MNTSCRVRQKLIKEITSSKRFNQEILTVNGGECKVNNKHGRFQNVELSAWAAIHKSIKRGNDRTVQDLGPQERGRRCKTVIK